MKTNAGFFVTGVATLFLFMASQAGARGRCGGHGHVMVCAGHSSAYKALYQLRDSSFPGYVVLVKHDTLRGTLCRFGTSDLRLMQDGGRAKGLRIPYHTIKLMHLEEAAGPLQLTSSGPSGFYRLLVNNDSLALYDRKLTPHLSIADADTGNLIFRYRHFSRGLDADFASGRRKRVVSIINTHYATSVTRSTTRKDIYRIMEQAQ